MPLQFASYFGVCVTFISFLFALHALYVKFITHTAIQGWTSLLIAVVFLGGVQLLTLGIIGEYIGRIYQEIKRRPLYVLKDQIGFKHAPQFLESVGTKDI